MDESKKTICYKIKTKYWNKRFNIYSKFQHSHIIIAVYNKE